MGLFDRIGRVFRANMNDMVSKAEDPEKMLEQAIRDMNEDMVQLRQAVAKSIATQKRTEQQYNKNQQEAGMWQTRAQLALSKGDEKLAREALVRKKSFADTAAALKQQLDNQNQQVESMKRNLIVLEGKISEAKTKKDMLKARVNAAKANKQLQGVMGSINTEGSMAVFERMEEKVLMMEAESQSALELTGLGMEQQFAQLEASSGVDDELAMMKLQLSGGSPDQGQLPASETAATPPPVQDAEVVDSELEELRRQLGQ